MAAAAGQRERPWKGGGEQTTVRLLHGSPPQREDGREGPWTPVARLNQTRVAAGRGGSAAPPI